MNRARHHLPPQPPHPGFALDTTAALHAADPACSNGHHQPVTVGPEAIYGPGLIRRAAGERYCRHCFTVLEVA